MEFVAGSSSSRHSKALSYSPRQPQQQQQQQQQPWAAKAIANSPPEPSPPGTSSSLPPLDPTSPRKESSSTGSEAFPIACQQAHPRSRPQNHDTALQLPLEHDYPVAQVDSWPLSSRTSYKRPFTERQTPPLSPGKKTLESSDPIAQILRTNRPPDCVGYSSATFSSPISPRQRKALQHHSLLDESKTKPQLLQELQAFVDTELSELAQQQQHIRLRDQNNRNRHGSNDTSNDGDDAATPERIHGNTRSCLQRLQVFRQVLQRVIAAFSVYAPVLAQIQDEYERAISQLRAQSLQVPKLRAQLQTLQSHCVQEIAAHNLETKIRSKVLKKQLKNTQGRLTALAAQNATLREQNAALQSQVETLGRRSTEMQLSNHSLVNGIKRHDDTLRHIHERSREEGMALAQMASKYHHACEEIAELKKTIATLEEKVGGVHVAADKATIALLTHDLQDTHAKLQSLLKSSSVAALDKLQHDVARQSALGGALIRVLDAQGVQVTVPELLAVVDRIQPAETSDELQPSAADITSDGAANCAGSQATTAVEALAAYVLEKLAPLAQREPNTTESSAAMTFLTEPEELRSLDTSGHMLSTTDLLIGRGCGVEVPEFLRFDGVVRNLHYPRKKLEQILARMWQQKDDLEKIKRSHLGVAGSGGGGGGGGRPSLSVIGGNTSSALTSAQQVPLAKVFSMMLNRMSLSRSEAIESAYNILAALERFAPHSSDCRLFLEILRGEIPEEARQDQLRELYAVHDALAALEKDRNASTSGGGGGVGDPALPGRVPLADVVQLLRKVFPWKLERALSELHRSLLVDQRGIMQVDYAALLLQQQHDDKRSRTSSGRGGRSHFAECLRSQYIDDLVAYRCHLQGRIKRRLLGSDKDGTSRSHAAGLPSGDHVVVINTSAGSNAAHSEPPSSSHDAMVSIRNLRDLLQDCDIAKPVQEINQLLATASGLSLDQVLTQDALMVNAQHFLRKLPTLLVKPTGKFPRSES